MAMSNISPLVHAEVEARRRAGMLQSIVDAVPHGIAVYSADRHVIMFNRAYTDVMSGAPLSVGDHLLDVIRRRAADGEYGAGDPEQIALQQMAFDVTRPQNRKRRRPNGVVVDVRTSPLPDGGYISVVTDISPLTAAEAEVSRRAEELAAMLSSIRHGVLLWGSDRRLVASNAIASELLEQPPGELAAGHPQDAVLSNMLVRGVFGSGLGASAQAETLRGRTQAAAEHAADSDCPDASSPGPWSSNSDAIALLAISRRWGPLFFGRHDEYSTPTEREGPPAADACSFRRGQWRDVGDNADVSAIGQWRGGHIDNNAVRPRPLCASAGA